MYDFKGKVALVTGAARMRGFGHATAVRFAMEGADVVANGRYRPPEKFPEEERVKGWKGLDSVVAEIEAQGVRALGITADVTDSKQVKNMVDKALAEFGHIDFLIANAGIEIPGPFLGYKEDDWHRTLAVNLDGVFYCCQAVAGHMVERGGGGAIVNTSSRLGKTGAENETAYCASKFGVNGFTQALGKELAPYNIRVNSVCPGQSITNMTQGSDAVWKLATEKKIDMMEAAKILFSDYVPFIPMKRAAYPEELASVIVFLCSDEASYITGQNICVDGGRQTSG